MCAAAMVKIVKIDETGNVQPFCSVRQASVLDTSEWLMNIQKFASLGADALQFQSRADNKPAHLSYNSGTAAGPTGEQLYAGLQHRFLPQTRAPLAPSESGGDKRAVRVGWKHFVGLQGRGCPSRQDRRGAS